VPAEEPVGEYGPVAVLCAEDYEALARAKLRADNWDFVAGGSGTERTLAANRAAFDRVAIRPRVLVDVSTCETAMTLLGASLSGPIGVAPTAYHRMLHPDGELATARGAADVGALYITAFFASQPLEAIGAVGPGPRWLQLYWLRDRDAFASVIDRAAAAGFTALVLTVDAPVLGQRLRDLRNRFALDADIRPANLDLSLTAGMSTREQGRSAVAQHALHVFDPSITWADLAWLRQRSPLPLLIKGILTAEDALLAVEHGAAGIVVSNHGGRQLDNAVASLDALPEVVDAVAGRCPVLVDGGVRTGTDVLVALALGADAVLLGRPVLWALAAEGAAGVANVLTLLRAELANAMALAGRPTLASIDRSAVRPR
jgi:4-hydroxymandelate oxidase